MAFKSLIIMVRRENHAIIELTAKLLSAELIIGGAALIVKGYIS